MSKAVKLLSFLLVILFSVSSDFAQRKPVKKPAAPAKSVQNAKDAAQRKVDEAAVAQMDDPGFDAAIVVKPGAILDTPAANGKILIAVKRGDSLSLVEREPLGNWYRVVQSESGDEGWIDGKLVVIKLTGNTETGPPLEAEDAAANAAPEVTISNLEDSTTLKIRLNGKLYLIPPGTSKTVPVSAGKFTYYGWSPGIRPATGNSILEKGKKYSWRFKIYKR